MIAHTQTLFGSVALVAIIMSSCLILVGQFNRGNGMLTAGLGMLCHSLAYVAYTLFGHAPLWLTYGVGNTLLSMAMAFYTLSIPLIHGQPPPWRLIFAFPAGMALLLGLLISTQEPRQLAACVVLISQCMLIVRFAHRFALPKGRAHLLLMIGASISLISLGIRIMVILGGDATEMHYDVSNLKQSISVAIGTVTVIMLSLGLVLLSRERIEMDLEKAALDDPLTGISNRLAILGRLTNELGRASRQRTPLSIAMLDIDHFKQVNDKHGHLIGDAVLRYCVEHLHQRLRRTDSIGRYGGEEFLLLLPGTDAAGAAVLIDQLRQSLTENPAHIEGIEITLSFSAGVYGFTPDSEWDLTQLLKRADAALYEAKHAGRNRVRTATA